MASLFFVAGSGIPRARERIAQSERAAMARVTSPNPQVIVLRALAPLVEPAMQLLREVRNAWRQELWQLPVCNPRVWSM